MRALSIRENNGIYKVAFYQHYNVDEDRFIGRSYIDIRIILTEIPEIVGQANKVFWCTFY